MEPDTHPWVYMSVKKGFGVLQRAGDVCQDSSRPFVLGTLGSPTFLDIGLRRKYLRDASKECRDSFRSPRAKLFHIDVNIDAELYAAFGTRKRRVHLGAGLCLGLRNRFLRRLG